MIREKRVLVLVLVALCGVLVAGCSQALAGSAYPLGAADQGGGGNGSVQKNTHNKVLGDVRALDTCAFVTEKLYEGKAAKSKVSIVGNGYGGCWQQSDLYEKSTPLPDDASDVEKKSWKPYTQTASIMTRVNIRYPYDSMKDFKKNSTTGKAKHKYKKEQIGPYEVFESSELGKDGKVSRCTWSIQIAGDSVEITVYPSGSFGTDLSKATSLVAQHVVSTLSSGHIPRLDPVQGAISAIDLCDVANPAVKKFAVRGSKLSDIGGAYGCYWKKGGHVMANVYYDDSSWPPFDAKQKNTDTKPATVNGKEAYCSAGKDDGGFPYGYCEVKYDKVGFKSFDGKQKFTVVTTVLSGNKSASVGKISKRERQYAAAVVKTIDSHR